MAVKCMTEVKMDIFRYEWTIGNYKFYEKTCQNGECIRSSKFSSKANEEIKWSLILYPLGIDQEIKYHSSLMLQPELSGETELRAKYVFSVLIGDGIELVHIENHAKFTRKCYHGSREFLDRSGLAYMHAFPDGKLRIGCEITAASTNTTVVSNVVQVPECTILDDFGRLLEDLQLSDVVLSTGKKEYRAHKAILAARSPVFAAMFQHEMEEKKLNRVDIADIEHEVLEEVLKYIYTAKVDKLEKMADKLLAAADKYGIIRLKALCEKSLYAKLSVENAANALVIADLHSAAVLKTQAINFIKKHEAEIAGTVGWDKMLASNPHLVTEIFRTSLNK